MTPEEKCRDLRDSMYQNLQGSILPFWCENMVDEENGGFYGCINEQCIPEKTYPKAIVLNTRMLWTCSTAYRFFGWEPYKQLAQRAYDYINDKFWDHEYGGIFWMLNYRGIPMEVEKRTYGQAFYIYAMAEYARAFQEPAAIDAAMSVFEKITTAGKTQIGGYVDSLSREWKKDHWLNRWYMNTQGAPLLLNSHLHLFEALIALYTVTHSLKVRQTLLNLLEFILDYCVDDKLGHLKAGIDECGNRIDDEISFGHDAECCHLLTGAARLLADDALIERADKIALRIMDNVLREGIDPVNGGLFYERYATTGEINKIKIWWVQAEGILSFFNCYQLTMDEKYLDAAMNIWAYVKNHLFDLEYGDWYSLGRGDIMDVQTIEQIKERETRFPSVKANKSKCPYHNSRACFEIIERINNMSWDREDKRNAV